MSEQIESIGFDVRCEFCGNYYASDYIDFHREKRCSRKRPNADNTLKLLMLSAAKPGKLPEQKKLKEIHKDLVNCQHCNATVKLTNLERHFLKCPVVNPKKVSENKIQIRNSNEKLRSSDWNWGDGKLTRKSNSEENLIGCKYCSLKIRAKNLKNHISIFHPSIYVSSLKVSELKVKMESLTCLDCGAVYSSSEIDCPRCKSHKNKLNSSNSINKIFRCKQCGEIAMYATSVCRKCGDK